jgi:hypothetical protein
VPREATSSSTPSGVFAGVLYASIELLIVARARNVIGWTLWLSGLFISLQTFSSVHPVVCLETRPSSLTVPNRLDAPADVDARVRRARPNRGRDRTIPALRSSATAVPVIP